MKRCLLLWFALTIVTSAYADLDVYVSSDAATDGDGSRQRPYRNLTAARDRIRLLRKAGTLKKGEMTTVHIEPGIYPSQASFELTAEDSGTEGAPVVYRARDNQTARLQGGMELQPSAFKPVDDSAVRSRLDPAVRDKVRVCDLSNRVSTEFPEFQTAFRGAPVAPWLYVNHQPMTLARWPNAASTDVDGDSEWASFSQAVDTGLPQPEATDPARRKLHPGSFVFEDSRPTRWNLADGVWLFGYWTHDWSDEVIRIASYDKEKQVITLAAPHSYGINAGTWGASQRRFYAMNLLEELDAPGEWYLDREEKRLYFYPQGDLAAAEIVLATLTQPLIKMNGARHVKLVGLDLEYGHGDGISARNAQHVEIAGCVIANLAGGGISLSGSHNIVRSCDIFNIGRGGIALNGGDRKSLTRADNVAENNHIHHFGMFQRTYAPGLAANGCGQIARHNRIHDAPHNAVLYGGNEHRFEANEVYRVVMETGDAGAFYTGRDWTSQGNILRHNYIHDLGSGDADHVNTMGIYLDDCDSGDTLEGNVFYRAGRAMMIGGGRDNRVLNNLVVDCPIGLHVDARGMTWKQWNNPDHPSWCLEEKAKRLDYTQPPWSTKYPRLAAIMNEHPRQPLGNTIRRNVFIDCSKQVYNFDGNVKKLLDKFQIADNLAVSTTKAVEGVEIQGSTNISGTEETPITPGPEDPANGSFPASWQSWIQKQLSSFEPIPFEKIGLYRDEYRRTLPDQR